MLTTIIRPSEEFPGVMVTRFATALARGVAPFSNQQCAATIKAQRAMDAPVIRTNLPLPVDGNAQRSKFNRKIIRALCAANPRREGTKGHKSYALLLKAGGDLDYALYKLQGGRPNDLQWDLDHGYAEIIS